VKREKFTYLCLALSVIGLAILQVSTTYLKPEVSEIQSVDSSKVGETLKLEGNVTGFYSTRSASFFTLKDSTGEVQIVSFNSPELRNGQNVTVLGQVELMKGNLQVVSSEIEQSEP